MSAPITNTPVQSTVNPAVESNSTVTTPAMEKLKINGREVQVSIDELKRAYGLHKASDTKFQEAAKMRKEAESVKEAFSQKDINNLIKAGWTEEEIEEKAADFLVKRAQRKSMTPQQIAQMEREREYETLKKEKEARELAEKTKTETELRTREAKLLQTAFIKDIQTANSKTWLDLEDPVILSNVINEITTAINKYDYDMSVDEAVKRLEERLSNRGAVKKEYLRKLLKMNIKDIEDSDLDAFLEKGGKGVREKSVEVFKKAEAPFAKLKPQTQSTSAQTGTPVRDAQYYRNIRMGRAHLNK